MELVVLQSSCSNDNDRIRDPTVSVHRLFHFCTCFCTRHNPLTDSLLLRSFTNVSCDALSDWCTIEYWITLGCLYLGAIFYSLLISSISSILQTASLSSRQFDEHLLRIDDYMRTKKLPAVMREKVKDYFYLQFSDGKLHREDEIFDFLSPVLRREIKQFTGRDICRKVPLLSSSANKDFAQDMACVIEPTLVFANEVLMRQETTGNEMFFICSGVIEIFVAHLGVASSYLAIGDGCVSNDNMYCSPVFSLVFQLASKLFHQQQLEVLR